MENWRIMGHEVTNFTELDDDYKFDGNDSYLKDLLTVEKSSFILNFNHHVLEGGRKMVCFEKYNFNLMNLPDEGGSRFFSIRGGRMHFTNTTKFVLVRLINAIKELGDKGLDGRIPDDPTKVVFVEDNRVLSPKVMFNLETDEVNGFTKLKTLLTAWVDGKKAAGNELAPTEMDFLANLGNDEYNLTIVHPALWLPGVMRRFMTESYIHFSEAITEGEISKKGEISQGNHRAQNRAIQDTFGNLVTKYDSWLQHYPHKHDMLKMIYNDSKRHAVFKKGFMELFEFHRNTFLHVYDLHEKNAAVRRAKAALTTEDLEDMLADSYPTFALDLYKQVVSRFGPNLIVVHRWLWGVNGAQ